MNARGSSSVLLLGVFAFVAAIALALVPVARVLVATRRAQTAADAAALAATDELALGGPCSDARAQADANARTNRALLIGFACVGPTVTVTVRAEAPVGVTRQARAVAEPCVRCGVDERVPPH